MKRDDRPSRRKRILDSFQAALARPASNRADYLRAVCADDPEMRLELEALLTASRRQDAVDAEGVGEVYRAERGPDLSAPGAVTLASPSEIPSSLPARDEAARRPLSVLFCDLVGSTELSQRLDAEDYHELITRYQDEVSALIERYGGHIAQYLGDGILACFGYPLAQDNDAERAVRAGHDLVAAVRRLNGRFPDTALAVRVGIHSGQVVVKPPRAGRAETVLIGETINIAARLQTAAEPHSVLISDATLRLLPGLFITRDLGAAELKGLTRPIHVHRVVQPSGVRSRLEAAERLTPMVGRETEQALLRERWALAQAGHGQAVLLSAEPGVGKSRLLLDLRRELTDSAHTWLEVGASPQSRTSAYQPVIELLHRGLMLRDADSPELKMIRVEQSMTTIGFDLQESVPLLATLLRLPLPAHYPPSVLGPELQRQRTLDLLCRWVIALAQRQPLILVFEDLHWMDASSLTLLGTLLERLADAPLLLLMSARPEFLAPWALRPPLSLLALHPLAADAAARIVRTVSGGRALPPDAEAMLIERAGGVPLYLEELTKALLESGQLIETGEAWQPGNPLQTLRVPDSLQGSLMARLDRLGPARELIQIAAVIGREVSRRLLLLVSGLDEAELDRQLLQLMQAGLLYAPASAPDAGYLFKHALIQDIARDALLKTARQQLHGRIAQALKTHFPERADKQPQVLAMHFEQAGQIEAALPYFHHAAENAAAAGSLSESIAQCEHALDLLRTLPESAARDHLELMLCLPLGNSRMASLGYGHHTVHRVFTRALELCSRTYDPALRGRALGNVFLFRYSRAEFEPALALAEQIIALGRDAQVDVLHATGHLQRGWALLNLGRLGEAVASCERGLSLFTPETAQIAFRAFGHDPYVAALMPRVYSLWLLGFPDRALRTAEEAVRSAEQHGHPHSVAWALRSTMPAQLFRRQPEGVVRDADRCIELSTRYGLTEWVGFVHQFLGLAECMRGHTEAGLSMLRAANAAKQARGTLAHRSQFAALEAEQCRLAGRFDEARGAVTAGLQHVEQFHEHYWEAELHRVRGELALAEPGEHADIAEACFRRALEISRAQQARSLELRAATSLARLLQGQARIAEASALLQPLYLGFTEGLDTPDLLEARQLLDSLSQG